MKTQQLKIKLRHKTEENIKKARKSPQAGDDLSCYVDLYNQARVKWFEDMMTTTLELEQLEVERVEMIQQHLCQYTQLWHEMDIFNQSTVEPVDQLLQKVNPKTENCGSKTENCGSESTKWATFALWTWRSRHACVALGGPAQEMGSVSHREEVAAPTG
ncbi:Growth arrest-specific protein 7 [Sciurus carolinensis]|uniref:Growth arrest-specific protein 7 n=1 Tax=Sciurus carolinensis TaxID=30640 RepID=A0AA41TAB9_SCICA|nr:Growth arrest-specific protein 7 [Sciurus carolinensis]